jgi:hypothetical protein
MIFYYSLKGHGCKRIDMKLVITDHRDAYPIYSVKPWGCEYESGRRDPIDFPKAGKLPSDIAEAVSQTRSDQPFSSTKYIATQRRMSRKLMKRTLTDVVEMRKFSLHSVLHLGQPYKRLNQLLIHEG